MVTNSRQAIALVTGGLTHFYCLLALSDLTLCTCTCSPAGVDSAGDADRLRVFDDRLSFADVPHRELMSVLD